MLVTPKIILTKALPRVWTGSNDATRKLPERTQVGNLKAFTLSKPWEIKIPGLPLFSNGNTVEVD